MSNGTDPLVKALREGRVRAPGYTPENLAASRMTAFPFKKLGKYDKGITSAIYEGALDQDPLKLQEYYRGEMQSGAKKLLNGIVSRGLSTGTKVGQGFGHVLGTGAAILSGDAFKGDWSLAFDNPIAEAFANMDEGLKEMAPVYMSQEYGEGNLLQKMGTATFWASDFADGVAFLASAYAPGWGIGKLGQMVKGGAKLKMLAGLKKIGIDSNSLTVGASSIYNTVSEAGVEAYHVNKDLRQELIAAGVPEDEARMRAGEAAAETFGFNMATLWLSNVPQSQWFHGNVKNRHNKLKNLIRNGETSAGELNKRYTWWKSALKGAATEGLWEENLQTSIERYEKRFVMGETDAEWLSGIFGEAWTNVKGFVKTFSPFHDAPAAGSPEDQGATSIALGMLIGAPMSSYAEYREHIGEQDELKQIQDWWKSNIDYTSMGLKAFAEDAKAPYKTFTKEVTTKNEDGKETTTTVPSMLNDKNRTEEDPNKIANIMMRHLANKKYFDESVIAAIKNDAIHDGFNKHLAFASFVHSLYSNPNMEIEDIEQAINQAIKSTEQSEEARDLKVNEFIQDNMQLARQYYQALEEIDSKISGDFDFKEDPAAQSFKRNFRKSLLYAKVKQNVGQEIANNSTDEKLTNAANNIVDDATTFLEGAYKNRQKIWGAYSKFYDRFMEATKNAKEATEDKEQYKNGYWAKELSETLNVTKVEHPEFWTAEPLVANQDARKTATNPHTIRERNAANRGQMYLDNNAAQNAMDQEGPIDQIAEKLSDLPELTTETKNKAQKFLGRIEETKKANQEKIDELQTLHDDLQDGIGWEYVDELIGGKATQQDVTKALIQIRRDLLDLKNENETLDAYQKDVEYALGSNKKLKPNMKPLPIQFLEQELGPVDALINAFERNPNEFARLQETLNAIAQVKALIEFFTERKDTTKRIKDRALVLLQQRLNKLNKAEVAAAENTQNKANANLIKEQQKVRSLMSALNYDERFFNTELTKLIKGAVDTDEWEKLNKEYEKSEGVPYPNSYAAMLSLIEAIRDHESSKEVIKGIKDSRKKTLQQFAEAADVTDNMTSSYADAPHAVVFTLLSNYIQRSLGIRDAFNDPNLPFYQWKKTNDIYALRDELAKDPKYAQLLYITTLHIDYTAAGTVLDYLESNTSYKDIFEGVHKNIDEDLTPSVEQMMAATEIVAALLNKQVDDDYANAVYLRGPAGSGKTTIVANLVLKTFKSLTETGDSQIMISGHKKTSADNLAKELGMKVTYLEELAEADLSSTKLVVIDEAAGMLPLPMNAIAEKIQNHNKTVSNDKEKIRLFLLGDPSQITRQDVPLALRSGHTVDPITVIYRTSVGAVENAFMEFKDNPNKVDNLLVQSSHTVMEAKSDNESLFGVMAGTAIDMIDVIKARPLADGRRRAVIVNHENNKAPYEGLGVEVLTYEEAQGETIDEVYLDLNRNKTDFRGNQFEDDLEFNTAVYTAMSRAKFFVYTNVPGITSTKSANLNQDTSSNKDLFEALKEQYSDYFDAHQYFLSEINGKELDTTPVETEEPPATPDEVVDEEVPEEPPSGPPTPEDKDVAETAPQKGSEESVSEGKQVRHSHYMFYPDNAAIGTWLNDPTNELSYTGKGYVIKSKSSSAAGYNLSVVAERSDGKYDVVGVLSDKDFTDGDFGKALTKEWNKVWNDPKHPMGKARGGNSTRFPVSGSSRKIGLTFGDQGQNSFDDPIMEVTIEGISPMDVVLDPEKRFRDMGEGFIQRLLANVYENIFKGAKLKADPKNKALIPGPDGEIDLNKINGNDIRVEIFSHKSADEIATRGNFRPQPGRPYLVIENMLPEGSSRTQSNPFLIPLANLPFSKESKWYQPLANFYEALVQVEEATGLKLGDSTIALENLIRYIAEKNYKGVQHPDGKREIVAADNPMTMADIVKKVDVPVDPEALASVSSQIETLIREGFGVQRKPMVMTEAEFKKSKYNTEEFEWVPFDTTTNGKVVGVTIDSQTGERTENPDTTPYDYLVVPNQGPAQYALSELAKANKEVGNTTIRIGSLSDRKKGKYHILSRTLFRKHRDDEYAFIYGQLRRIYKEEFGKKSSGLSGKAVRKILLTKGLVTEAELQEMEDAYLTPQITSETLRLIVDFPGKYHSTSSQQGPRYLREPIDMFDFNQKFGRNLKSPKARKIVEKLVGSKVVSTNPLSVKISITSDVPASGQAGYTPTIQEITPNVFEIEQPKPDVRDTIKESKRKDGWISKEKLGDIVADAGAIIDITDAIAGETEKSVKIENEERITITQFEPTVANDPVTEEELIKRIKDIDPTVLKETLPLIEGKSESERLAFLMRVFSSINHSGLSDDVNYAYDANRMKKMAKALGKELTEEQAKKLLNRLLPGMELTPEQVRFVSKEVMDSMASPEEDLWGLWNRGVMYFAYVERDGQKIFYENVVRHEVFHRIHQAHMSPEERQNLRKLVDAQYGTAGLSDYDYEEWLARRYQSWRANTFKARGFLRKWFKWVQRLLDWIFSNRNELEQLFNRIDYGFFTPSTYRDLAHASRQAMKFIKDDFKKVDVFKEAVNVIRKGFNRYLYIDPKFGGGQNGLVVSETEAIKFIRQDLDQALIKRQAQKAQALETMEMFPEGTATHTKAALTSSMLDLRIAALEVLTRKENSPFDKVIEYLYPNSIYLSEAGAERTTEETFIEEIVNGGNDTLTGVAAQIEENETKNHELKLSSSMRHWLSSIMRKKKNKDSTSDLPVSERYAYFQMLQFFQMIELNGMTFELKDLQAQKDYILKNTALGEAGQRVLDRLIQTAEEATQQTYGKYNVEIPRDQNIVFQHNELTGDTTYYFIQGPEASTFSFYDEIKDNPQIKVFKMRSKELLPIFDALNKEGILTDKELFNALYKRTVARDVLRSAQNNFKMKEMDILIGIQSFDFGKSYFRYVKGRTLGLHTSLRSTFQDALYNYILNGHHHKGYNKVKALLESKQYQEGIQEFLNQMGLGFLAKDFQSGNLEQMALTITNTIGEAIEAGENMTPEHLETFIDPETKQEEDIIVDNIQVWLDDNETIVAEFIQALKFNFEWLRNTSVRSGDNKKLYKFSNSSYMHDLLYNLINSSEFQGSPGTQTFRKLPEFLRTEFYRNNPYVKGLARLYDINYHDAYRNDYSKSVRTYDRENKSEWYRREFTFGFIDGLATSKQKATSYHQFTYPLSDRTRIPALRTKLLSPEESKEAIKMAITQIRHRSRSKFFKGYDYTKNTNFEVYDEKAQKMGLDEATEYIFEKLMERGKETAKTLINEQVPVPYNLEKAVSKAKSVWKGLPNIPKNLKYRQGGEYKLTTEMLEPLAQMYEVNTYINSYFLTQLFAGDHAYYGDSVIVVKRMAGPSAPGTAPLVAPEFGMKAKAKLAIMADKAIPFEAEDTIVGEGTVAAPLKKLADKLSSRFGIPYEVLTAEQLTDFLERDDLYFQILDDIDIFNSNDLPKAKEYIDKAFRAVSNKEEAKKVYRKLSKKYHPDINQNENASLIFKHLNTVNEQYQKGQRTFTSDYNQSDFTKQYTSRDYSSFYENQKAYEQRRKSQEELFKKRQELRDKLYDLRKKYSDHQWQMIKARDEATSRFWKEKIAREERARKNFRDKELYDELGRAAKEYTNKVNDYQRKYTEANQRNEEKFRAAKEKIEEEIKNTYNFQKINGSIAGFYDHSSGKAYLVEGLANSNTPIHEIFTHPFLQKLKRDNVELYNNLLEEAKANKEVIDYVEKQYGGQSESIVNDELIARAIDLEVNGLLKAKKSKGLIDAIKKFFEELTDILRNVFSKDFITVNELPHDTTLKDLGIFALSSDTKINLGKGPQSSIEKFLRQFLTKEQVKQVKDYFSAKGFEMTDAQGLLTPERKNDLLRGFGRSYGLGNVMKPVYFSIETIELPFNEKVYDTEEQAEKAKETYGRSDLIVKQNPTTPEKYSLFTKEAYPLYLKYSSIVLSDELLEQFPYLEVIREKMRSNSIDEIVFQSGVKVGSPAVLSSSEDLVDNIDDFTFSNTLSVDNKHFRMQLNPRHDPEDKVSMFTQITYFLNVFNSDPKVSNDPEARAVYNALAFIVKEGLEQSKKKFNNPTSLAKKLLSTPGYETALELLEADVSIDNPAIEKLLTTQFAAKLSNDTVSRVKFPGGKYTLQSAYGIYKNKLEKGDIPTEADELQYRVNPDGSLYAEMILPYGILSKEQEDAVKRGDELFLHGDGFAFRIPSTELHSAISIKVVGIYDDLKTNVIIGPKELVPLHGSDFDADSLSVVMRTRAKSNFRFMDIKLYKDDFIGYMLNDDGKYVLDPDFPEMLHNAIKQTQKFSDSNSKKIRKRLLEIQEDYAKNVIAETMMMVIRHPRNRPRMLTPISMERFNGYYGGESMLELLKKNGDPDPQKKYDVSSSEGRYMAYKSIFDGAALTGVFANAIKSLAYMIKSGPGSSGQNEMLQRINGLAATLKDAPEELKQNIEEEIERLQGEMMQYEGPSNSLPEIKEDYRLTIDGHTYTHLSEEERNEAKTSIWETLDALVNSAIDNAKEQIMFMIGANGITANAISAMVGMGIPLDTIVFFMRQPIIQELSKSKYYGRVENGLADLREQLKKKAEEDENYELTTESLAKRIQPTGTELDWDNLSKEDAKHYLAVLNQFEKAWKVGKSIEVMANYLNLVRGMPVTAEAIGKTREIIEEIGEFSFQFFNVQSMYDLQAYNGMATGTLTTNDSFAFDIPNFLSNNPHIAVAHEVFEELEKILQTTFFVHSSVVKNFIKSLHLTGQIELAKGDKDSAILNRIQFAREFQKYLMSSIYANKFLSESTPYYYTNYKGEKEYLEGSKAWFQHFITKVQTLQKHLMKEGSDKITNYFLFNLSISGNDLKSMRYTAGSNLKYEDIILARDSFEELNKYSFKETLYEGDNPEYEIVENQDPPQFTDFQKDFIVFSILNNGLQYSITSLSQVLPPVLFKESDDQLQSVSRSVKSKEEVRNNLRDHFKLSMVAANADQLKWVPSDGEQSKLMPKGKRYVMLKGNILKELDNYAGKTEDGLYYDLSYVNKAGDNASSVFPEFIRTSEGRSAIAYIRMNNPTEPIVYYQRIGKNPTGFYEMADVNSPYNMYDYFNLRIPTVHATSAKSDIITVDRSLEYVRGVVGDDIFAVVDNRDITRKDRRFVKVVGQVPREAGKQFQYKVEDAFKSKEEETEYLNGIFAEEDLHETYSVTIEDKKGILKTYENEVTDAPNDIAKHVIGKDITEAQKYIKDNNWKIRLLPKKCRR